MDLYMTIREDSACDFLVEDESGTALIRANTATSARLLKRAGWPGPTPERRRRAFLARHGCSDYCERWHPEEWVLEQGSVVAVFGVAAWELDPAPDVRSQTMGYREAPHLPVIRAPEGLPVLINERSAAQG